MLPNRLPICFHRPKRILALDDSSGLSHAFGWCAELWQGGFEPFEQDYNGAQAAGVFLRFPGQWDDAAWSEAGSVC